MYESGNHSKISGHKWKKIRKSTIYIVFLRSLSLLKKYWHCQWFCFFTSNYTKKAKAKWWGLLVHLWTTSYGWGTNVGSGDPPHLVKAMVFQYSCMDVRVGPHRKLSAEELMLLNRGVGEDSWESLGLQGDPTSPFWRRSALGFLWKEWC